MKTKAVIAVLMSIFFFVSCEDAHKRLEDNLGRYHTLQTYLTPLYESLEKVEENPDGVKRKAQNLIEYVDMYLTYQSKEVPSSADGVSDIDNAALYCMSIARQIAVLASDFAGKSEILDVETIENQYYNKFDSLEEDLERTFDRWSELQEEYAKKHGVRLIDISNTEESQ